MVNKALFLGGVVRGGVVDQPSNMFFLNDRSLHLRVDRDRGYLLKKKGWKFYPVT